MTTTTAAFQFQFLPTEGDHVSVPTPTTWGDLRHSRLAAICGRLIAEGFTGLDDDEIQRCLDQCVGNGLVAEAQHLRDLGLTPETVRRVGDAYYHDHSSYRQYVREEHLFLLEAR